jgi:hypothetical protein
MDVSGIFACGYNFSIFFYKKCLFYFDNMDGFNMSATHLSCHVL